MGIGLTREEYEEEAAEAAETERKWLHISGVIGGAYMAHLGGAPAERALQTIWLAHQRLLGKSAKGDES